MVMNQLNGILGGLTGGLGGMFGSKTSNQPRNVYQADLVIEDGDGAYDSMAEVLAIIGALAAGSVWTKIWEKTVPAQQTLRWGFGSPATPYNQGYMWFCSLDEAVNFQHGKLRLVQADANENLVYPVKEYDDTRLHLGTVTTLATATPSSINDKQPLPEKVEFPEVREDSKLQLWYKCITPATAEDHVGFSIPATTRIY